MSASSHSPSCALRAAQTNGRPLGGGDFVMRFEQKLGRSLQRHKPGRKPREPVSGQLKLDIGNE